MSDRMARILMDEKRNKYYTVYLIALAKYLNDPTYYNKKKVQNCAKDVDSVPAGYQLDKTNINSNLLLHLTDIKYALRKQKTSLETD